MAIPRNLTAVAAVLRHMFVFAAVADASAFQINLPAVVAVLRHMFVLAAVADASAFPTT